MRSYLIISSLSPLASFNAEETLDLALTFSSLNGSISLVFLNDGVLQLIKNVQLEKKMRKNFTSILLELDLYDVSNVYVLKSSLEHYNLSVEDLIINSKLIEHNEMQDLINSHDFTLSF